MKTFEDACFVFVPNRNEHCIEKMSLLDGKVTESYPIYNDKLFDSIAFMRKI